VLQLRVNVVSITHNGLKLFLKETVLPKSSNMIIFILAPVFTFGLALSG